MWAVGLGLAMLEAARLVLFLGCVHLGITFSGLGLSDCRLLPRWIDSLFDGLIGCLVDGLID